MKRLIDIALAALALLALLPVLLLTGAAVWWGSGSPILFKQTRVGLNGAAFGMFKFRSMKVDAESTGPYFTQTNDPRITSVGRFLRRTSIDELPQLINVLLGDMSLVGPRPDVPEQRKLYSAADWQQRCSVRPGITGLAQAQIRSVGTHEDRLALDLRYVRENSTWLDLKILWQTLGRLTGKGSN